MWGLSLRMSELCDLSRQREVTVSRLIMSLVKEYITRRYVSVRLVVKGRRS
jgi:hypothetical protein